MSKGLFAVVAVDKEWGIGIQGQLLAHVSKDMKNFRALTSGKTVILGRKTLETFPGGKPLPKRKNIILSRNPEYKVDGAFVVTSVEQALSECGDGAAVIGGEQIYRQFLPYLDRIYVTKFDTVLEKDAFFPNLDEDKNWQLCGVCDSFTADENDSIPGVGCDILVYERTGND